MKLQPTFHEVPNPQKSIGHNSLRFRVVYNVRGWRLYEQPADSQQVRFVPTPRRGGLMRKKLGEERHTDKTYLVINAFHLRTGAFLELPCQQKQPSQLAALPKMPFNISAFPHQSLISQWQFNSRPLILRQKVDLGLDQILKECRGVNSLQLIRSLFIIIIRPAFKITATSEIYTAY